MIVNISGKFPRTKSELGYIFFRGSFGGVIACSDLVSSLIESPILAAVAAVHRVLKKNLRMVWTSWNVKHRDG